MVIVKSATSLRDSNPQPCDWSEISCSSKQDVPKVKGIHELNYFKKI